MRLSLRVTLHFIAVFYPDCEVSNTTVLAKAGEIDFKVTGREVLKPGWRAVFDKGQGDNVQSTKDSSDDENAENAEETKSLPAFVKGESGAHEPVLKEKTTTPPKYYTEATLLRAMETAGKTVDNDELREAMKENGIGRPSTRAAIIEKLYQRKYIQKQGKSIRATETGINLIHLIISPLLKSAELTGLWEKKLREIERGEYKALDFLNEEGNDEWSSAGCEEQQGRYAVSGMPAGVDHTWEHAVRLFALERRMHICGAVLVRK